MGKFDYKEFTIETLNKYRNWVEEWEEQNRLMGQKIVSNIEKIEEYKEYIESLERELREDFGIEDDPGFRYATGQSIE